MRASGIVVLSLVSSLAPGGCDGSSVRSWTDPVSGLTWENQYDGDLIKWAEAKQYCEDLHLGDHADWRLPTVGELRTLVRGCPATESGGSCNIEESKCMALSCKDDSCFGCSLGDGPGERGCYWPVEMEGWCFAHWSSSPVEDHPAEAWDVGFQHAEINYADFVAVRLVRCVR